jgi:hypothetical protein
MPFSLRLDSSTEGKIRRIARTTGLSKSAVVREAVAQYEVSPKPPADEYTAPRLLVIGTVRLAPDRLQDARPIMRMMAESRRAEALTVQSSRRSACPAFRQKGSDRRNELDRNLHDGRRRRSVRRFVLGDSFDVGLLFVVTENPLHSSVVPPWREPILLFLHGFFRCDVFRRRRKALWAFSLSPYAVMTNTDPGLGSGT